MDERIVKFLESLRSSLDGIPEQEADEAVRYYEEYLCDAQEEGKDIEQAISQLDPPEKIAAVIKAGTDIRRAENDPGIRTFNKAMKKATVGIRAPFSIFIISIIMTISYCVVGTFLAAAFVLLLGAVVIAMAAIYEAFRIPLMFFPEMMGTFGMGLLGGGVCMIIAVLFYRLAKVFISLSARLIRRGFRRGDHQPVKGEGEASKKPGGNRLVIVYGITALLGLFMFAVSGLPYRFFIIFNSMKPDSIIPAVHDYDTSGIDRISVVSAHSCITAAYRDGIDKIVISYEKPDWLDYDISVNGGTLSFQEKTNGRLPFFSLDTLHESRTEIKVLIPRDYGPDIVELESRGGFITIDGLEENIRAKTFTGKIYVNVRSANISLEAATETGSVFVSGNTAGNRTQNGMEYFLRTDSDKAVILRSSRGDISIK